MDHTGDIDGQESTEDLKAKLLQSEQSNEALRQSYKALQAKLEDRNTDETTPWKWLRQRLPMFTVIRKNVDSDSYVKYVPTRVTRWDNFPMEAKAYGDSHGLAAVRPVGVLMELIERSKVDSNISAGTVMSYVLNYVTLGHLSWNVSLAQRLSSSHPSGKSTESSSPASSATLANNFAEKDSSAFEPDLMVKDGERHILAIEMKPPRSFREEGAAAEDLVLCYNRESCANARHHFECVRQLLKYMVETNVLYGVLSSAEVSYFVRRVQGKDDCYSALEISNPMMFRSKKPTLLESLFYILSTATTNSAGDKIYQFRQRARSVRKDDADDEDPERDRKIPKITKELQKGQRKSLRPNTAKDYREMQETEVSNLHLEKRPYYTRGWSGKVAIGRVKDQKVAIKIARKYSVHAEVLLREIRAYKKLQKHWGTYVPELVLHGTTVKGTLVFIATKFIEGEEICKRKYSEAEGKAAEEALKAIHSSGILHGDTHGGNIIVVEGRALFIDFGFCKFFPNQADCARELNRLTNVFQEKCISNVTRS